MKAVAPCPPAFQFEVPSDHRCSCVNSSRRLGHRLLGVAFLDRTTRTEPEIRIRGQDSGSIGPWCLIPDSRFLTLDSYLVDSICRRACNSASNSSRVLVSSMLLLVITCSPVLTTLGPIALPSRS